ncbi:glycosyl hydrolase [Paenibacillus rhizovicinus]|uniref:beta-fructofuranosidase n=1 Tax=Paenibacillus rhizovicinus TaxID=2704463 RepID=A0A6C0P8D5_9BACL|nr:glycosyl hydrolase [Paenibacillus rhizovicinus]QHW32782.1 glycosyl hydrolase [Paenibacillus rhizovicinus]
MSHLQGNTEAPLYADLVIEQGDASQPFSWGRVNRFAIGFEIAAGAGEGELVSAVSSAIGRGVRIYVGSTSEMEALSLIAEMHTDARTEPLSLSIPWARIGDGRHDVLLHDEGHAVRLYVDGILVDEDWPMGTVDWSDAAVRAYAGTANIILSRDAAAPEAEGAELEGQAELAERYLGKEPATVQYWRPRGMRTGVGDCMPFFDGTTFRLYYLYDRRGHASKWGLGAHQWGQISTKDFIHWEHHPIAVGITEEGEGSICTGSVFLKDGIYYAYYAVRAVDGSPARLTYAVSEDGIRFAKTDAEIRLSARFTLSSVRDPHVFQDADGTYHMLVTTSLVAPGLGGEVNHQGCLVHLVSDNLTEWEERGPFIVPGYHDEPECSDIFEWNGWYYLIFSNDGLARYRHSRTMAGPWLRPAMDVLDCVQWRVPKTAPFPEDRRIAAGFLSSPGQYAGELVFRELVQHADGSLGLAFVPELREASGPALSIDSCTLADFNGFVSRSIGAFQSDYVLAFDVTAQYPNMYFGFSVSGAAGFADGHDVRFEPSARKVGVHRIRARSLQEDESSSIYHVEGLTEKVSVEAVVKSGWIDLCVNGSRTLISRIDGANGHLHLRFFAQFGSAAFEGVSVRPLAVE